MPLRANGDPRNAFGGKVTIVFSCYIVVVYVVGPVSWVFFRLFVLFCFVWFSLFWFGLVVCFLLVCFLRFWEDFTSFEAVVVFFLPHQWPCRQNV